MKLRIQDNSIRFRLTQSEVVRLATDGTVEGSARFSPAPTDLLSYAVEASVRCRRVRAKRVGWAIRVTLPRSLVRAWAATDQVSIKHEQRIGRRAHLSILVEKDFRCLHPKGGQLESIADRFPNPGDAVD